jgi:hypothetical protein
MLTIWPVEVAIAFAVAANVAGAILAYVLIPRSDEPAVAATLLSSDPPNIAAGRAEPAHSQGSTGEP